MSAQPIQGAPPSDVPGFHLFRRFAILSLISISLVCVVSSILMTRFMKDHMLLRYASTMHEFVQSVADIEIADAAAKGALTDISDKAMASLHRQLAAMPSTLRTNIYGVDGRLVWTSDEDLKRQALGRNEELEKAIQGEVEIETGVTGKEQHPKLEHMFLSGKPVPFVEIYLPIRDKRTGKVFGVAEIYRIPETLFESIDQGVMSIWMTGAASGLFLFCTLAWIVRRAQNTIRDQQGRLIESERLAVVGEMGAAVAHGIRNPLSSIRSSAELWLDDAGTGPAREAVEDIVSEVDKLEKWVRDLLTFSQVQPGESGRVDLRQLVPALLERFARELDKRGIRHGSDVPSDLPAVKGNVALFEQVLANLVANAMEAMPRGGELRVTAAWDARAARVDVTVTDTGVGMSPATQARLFTPFHTTKAKGMGLGLALVRRIVRRFGGEVTIDSALGKGASVTLRLAAQEA